MTLGTRLRKCRETKRFSQKEVAEFIGVSQTTYCNWENDTASFQVKHLLLLAQLFEVSILELIPEDSDIKASYDHLQPKNHTSNGSTVNTNQVYADLIKSKEEIIQLLRDENSRLKMLIETGI